MSAPRSQPAPRPVLAIAAPAFGEVSETFVARHVAGLAPDATVLVCQDGRGAERFGRPVLERLALTYVHATFGQRLRNALWRRLAPGLGLRRLSAQDDMRLMAFLRAHGVTVVLAEFGTTGLLLAPTCARLGLPLAVYFRGYDATAALRDPRMARRYARMFRSVAHVFAVSQAIADRLRAVGCPPDRLHVVPSGVDAARFRPGAPEPGRVLAVGRLTEKKAPHLTIRAFAVAARTAPGARLDMVGDGPLRPLCDAEIAAHGLGDRVALHGSLPHAEVAALMRRAAVFAQHSLTAPNGDAEGLPGAVVEAMACGLPVVATRHSGIPEAVVEGETGLLVGEGDVEGMGAALGALLADPARAAAMGAAGRARALERFTTERCHAQVRAVLGLPDPCPSSGSGGEYPIVPLDAGPAAT